MTGNGTAVNGRTARLVIVDDHGLVREGLRAVLEAEQDIEVVGEAQDGLQAITLCRNLNPDLVLMDVRMPGMDGLEATRKIKAEMPQVSVVVVTMHENPDYLLEAVRAGAAGYVLKDASGERIVGAVRRTLGGDSPLEEGLAMRLLARLAAEEPSGETPAEDPAGVDRVAGGGVSVAAPSLARTASGGVPEDLTAREGEVLGLLARGLTNPQIARTLLYSVSTVKVCVQSITAKLGVSDRTQAAVRAIELGLVTSGIDE